MAKDKDLDLFGEVAPLFDEAVENAKVRELIDRRTEVYGEPVQAFERIAMVWTGILGKHVRAEDVPLMMMGLKTVRTQITPDYADNSDDIEGYLDIFRKIVGPAMINARSVKEYVEIKDRL